ncbi:MAG TPA: Uma2 family endonuclease [Pyrinomonadaceae bacterium]|nr:Uma2 family endonuclease [Pyrinomonadaceae bacterium]
MPASTAELPHRKFTIDEYHNFIETGVFKPEERIELWEGEFVEMSPIGMRHVSCLNYLIEFLRDALGKTVIISPQNPIVLNDFSEPQSDIAILKRREDFYRNENATAADVLIVMEIADTTLKYDRDTKFPRYAASGIEEAWLIDLENDRVEIHGDPTEFGYSLVKILHRGQSAESTVLPEIKITIDKILG